MRPNCSPAGRIVAAASASHTSTITVPIAPPSITSVQGAASDLASSAAQIVRSIETAVGRIAREIADRLTGIDPYAKTLSYTAVRPSAIFGNSS